MKLTQAAFEDAREFQKIQKFMPHVGSNGPARKSCCGRTRTTRHQVQTTAA